MHGDGIITYKNGSKWTGTFRYGKKHGMGTFTDLEGNQKSLTYFWDWTANQLIVLSAALVLLIGFLFR